MSTAKERLQEELAQLNERRDKLHIFLGSSPTLSFRDLGLLEIQEKIMDSYAQVLNTRLIFWQE